MKYIIGIDFGSLSGRAVLANAENGDIISSAIYEYPHGVMSECLPSGKRLPQSFALQHPKDYLEVISKTVPQILSDADAKSTDVLGMGIDFTVCSPLPVLKDGTPLCFLDEFADEPHAYVKLWKHHAAQEYADRINKLAQNTNQPWLARYGGSISSEWLFPKLCEVAEKSPMVYDTMDRFIESGDWITWQLTGKEVHSASMASFKAIWDKNEGFVSNDFLKSVCPKLDGVIGTKVCDNILPVACIAGYIDEKGAQLSGLAVGTPVACPMCDAPGGLPGVGITEPGKMIMVLGTSTCHILLSDIRTNVEGFCGYAEDGIIPGYIAYESGQCCVGDHFDWFVKNCVPASYYEQAQSQNISIHKLLREKASRLSVGESGLIALDWWNGNRSVLDNSSLSGLILGLTLSTKPEEIYRALIEATAYGTKMIISSYESAGIEINEIIAAGGIAKKDPMLMQIYADVTGREIRVAQSEQSVALGSVVYAATACGLYKDMSEAAKHLIPQGTVVYKPITENSQVYEKLYAEYVKLHDYFGRGTNNVMTRLKALKQDTVITDKK